MSEGEKGKSGTDNWKPFPVQISDITKFCETSIDRSQSN